MQCIVVTPERTVIDRPADFVALTLYDGEIGIAPGHTPLIGRLGCGELRIRREGRAERYYVEGGFVEALDDVVSVLTHRAVAAGEIDEAVVRERLSSAQSHRAATSEDATARDRAVEQSRGQLGVARRAKQQKTS